MALPTNILQQVQTYQESLLAQLENLMCFGSNANTRFKHFDTIEANRGDTVTYDLPPRMTTTDGLAPVIFEGVEQRVQSLTVDKAKHVSYAFSPQEFIFNVKDYMDKIGIVAMGELASAVEHDLAEIILPSTYRFYGDGTTAINTYSQLAEAITYFKDYGSARGGLKGFLPITKVSPIINSGLSQFVLDRNEKTANSWELGAFSNCDWMQSNLLPLHIAGTVGNAATTLTVTGVTTDTSGAITQLICSGAAINDPNAIKKYDLLEFQDGVGSLPNLRYLTWVGHFPSDNKVQLQATDNVPSNGSGNVTIPIYPFLVSAQNKNQNIAINVQVGMQLKAIPNHRAGLLLSGNAFYVGMPKLPDTNPYESVVKTDPDTGISLRFYHGYIIEQGVSGNIHDLIWGKSLAAEYAMRIVFPA